MAGVKGARSIMWAGVEFQPNLQKPRKPIRLGVILVESVGDTFNVATFGRMPLLTRLPDEFQGLGQITLNAVADWVSSMTREATNSEEGDVFDDLASRWKWNLFITKPRTMAKAEIQGGLRQIGMRTYESFVGQPFKANEPKLRKPHRPPPRVPETPRPPAWHLRAFTGSDAGQFVGQ